MENNSLAQIQPNNKSRNWDWLVPILLVVILLIGAGLRLTGVNWDQDTHLHPDERFLTMVTAAITVPGLESALGNPPPDCAKWGGFFSTACSPFSPYNHDFGFFVYGTFPLFLTRLVGMFLEQTGYGQIHLVGRVLSALFDLSTVLLIFFIGRRLYGSRAALLGALFLALSVLDIQQSHFFTVDTFTNVPILIAFWFALDIADGKKWNAFVYAGAAFGLALAGRINIAPFAVVLIAAAALRAWRRANAQWRAAREAARDAAQVESQAADFTSLESVPESLSAPLSVTQPPSLTDGLTRAGTRAFFGLVSAAVVALIIFRIFQPYAANGPNFFSPTMPKLDLNNGIVNTAFDVMLSWAGGVNPKFSSNMTEVSGLVAGTVDSPPGHQWTNRPAYIFPFENMVLWGLGLPLGLAAWLGFAFALYRLVRYREWQHLLVVVWVGVTFAYTGQQWVKTMRYFLQIYPFLALLGGYFLVALWDRARAKSQSSATQTNRRWQMDGRLARVGVAVIALIVVGYTLFWAVAFTSIYTRDYTRVAASKWIFKNVPPGAFVMNETWDDPLPVRVEGLDPFGGMYHGIDASWYDEDTPEKRDKAIQWLDQTDYVFLSSNRLYGSIPRLPMRYPLTTKYYQWLFDGSLGFTKVAEFTSRPQLFGIEINDDNAEEAFTVYDHPKVMIYKKNATYSHANTAQLFNAVDLSEVYRFWPREATQAPTALLLTPTNWVAQLNGGTWSQIFNPGDWINQVPVLVWLAVIEILGWLALPLAFVIFRALADRGYIFAKALGLLIVAWVTWWMASIHVLPFSRVSILVAMVAVVAPSAFAVWKRRRDLVAFLRAHWRVVLIEEILFLVFFGAFLLIRYGNPDLWHQWYGGEKPMDYAYLNAIIKSTWMPPYDPWFAGGYINYYYFGQFITATLIKLTGIVPEVAYNLALPMYFALTALGAFSVAYNLVARNTDADHARPYWRLNSPVFAGLLAAIFVAVMSNLKQLFVIEQALLKLGGDAQGSLLDVAGSLGTGIWRVVVEHQALDIPIGWWYWNASRVIPDTINEFPFFTFLYADLHAHLMALAFTLVALGVAINFAVRVRDDDARLPFLARVPVSPSDIIEISVAALVLGALRAINFADYPTYLLVIVCALAIGEYGRRQKIDLFGALSFAWRAGALVVLSSLLFQPFNSNFATAYLATELWKGERTHLDEYLVVHGIFLFAAATFLIARTFDTAERRRVAKEWMPLILVGLVAGIAFFIVASFPAFAVAVPLLILATVLVLRPELDPAQRFIALLLAAGLAMTLMVELITYKGDIGRMNTVFKFYLQVWVFFGVASAAGVVSLIQPSAEQPASAENDPPVMAHSLPITLPTLWWAVFAVLIGIGLLYPLTATIAKVNDRFVMGSPSGLNGMDYLQTAIYQDRDRDLVLNSDRQAIDWLRANIVGSPVILEGNAPLYHWGSRVSIYTGLPTVLGWDWHEKQQRSIIDGAIIDNRAANVGFLYNTRDSNATLAMLKRYRVSYVYVGDLERAFYDPAGLQKFDGMVSAGQLRVVYQNDRVKVYQVN